MALKKDFSFDTKYGVSATVPGCYIKVASVEASKETGVASVSFYRGNKSELLEEARYQFQVDLEGENFIAQAYDYLKTLPEFSDATDC